MSISRNMYDSCSVRGGRRSEYHRRWSYFTYWVYQRRWIFWVFRQSHCSNVAVAGNWLHQYLQQNMYPQTVWFILNKSLNSFKKFSLSRTAVKRYHSYYHIITDFTSGKFRVKLPKPRGFNRESCSTETDFSTFTFNCHKEMITCFRKISCHLWIVTWKPHTVYLVLPPGASLLSGNGRGQKFSLLLFLVEL